MSPFRFPDRMPAPTVPANGCPSEDRGYSVKTATQRAYLTLEDCKRTALARNLDLQAARVEEWTKAAIRDSNKKRILPHLLFMSELSDRDNYGYAFSDVLGQEGLNPNPGAAPAQTGVTSYSVSHERSTWRYTLEMNWSPTDAALAYYLTKSGQNDKQRAHHQRVRVGQKLVGTVESAFFRLLSAQQRFPIAKQLARMRSQVLEQTKILCDKRLKPVEEHHRANQNALRAARILLATEEELGRQQNLLTSAMSLPPASSSVKCVLVQGKLEKPIGEGSVLGMELTAIQNRPEAYEAGLNSRNSLNDVKRTMIKLFPKMTGFWRYTRDKDRFLYNKDWKDIGVRFYFDVTEWLANWDESKAAKSNSAKADLTGGAVLVGIAAQVRTAAISYSRSLKELEYAESALKSSREVVSSAKAKAANNDITKLALLEAQADMLEAELEKIRLLGEANALFAELGVATGVNYGEPFYGT
jgi:outer membrane protein TolC